MNKAAVKKGLRLLAQSQVILDNMRALQTSPLADDFEAAWSNFLATVNSIHETLKTGCNLKTRQQFFAPRERVIRTDPLLRYLLHARGVDYHGATCLLRQMTSAGEPSAIEYDLNGRTTPTGQLGIITNALRIRLWYEMQAVTDLQKNIFNPPDTHLGFKLFDKSPVGLAEKAVSYYREMLKDAGNFTA
ncbi:MAG: hypothetical protein ABI673_10015 [Novosphingobium sp.]